MRSTGSAWMCTHLAGHGDGSRYVVVLVQFQPTCMVSRGVTSLQLGSKSGSISSHSQCQAICMWKHRTWYLWQWKVEKCVGDNPVFTSALQKNVLCHIAVMTYMASAFLDFCSHGIAEMREFFCQCTLKCFFFPVWAKCLKILCWFQTVQSHCLLLPLCNRTATLNWVVSGFCLGNLKFSNGKTGR